MTEMGQKRTFETYASMSALQPIADVMFCCRLVEPDSTIFAGYKSSPYCKSTIVIASFFRVQYQNYKRLRFSCSREKGCITHMSGFDLRRAQDYPWTGVRPLRSKLIGKKVTR